MLSSKDTVIIYQTLLSSPGMGEAIKLDLRVSRSTLLILSRIIEAGLASNETTHSDSLINAASKEIIDELRSMPAVILQKAGLADMYEKISTLVSK